MTISNMTPPNAITAEEAVLGACLIDSTALDNTFAVLTSADQFYHPRHRVIYQAMLALREKSEPVDQTTVANHLQAGGQIDKIGGRVTLVDLVSGVNSTANTANHAKIIYDKFILRRVIEGCSELTEAAYAQERGVDDVLDYFDHVSDGLRGGTVDVVQAHDKITEAMQRIEKYQTGEYYKDCVTFGIGPLDRLLFGLFPGRLYIIGGHTGRGKTQLALQILRHITQELKQPAMMASIEMGSDELIDRLIFSTGNVDGQIAKTPKSLSQDDYDRLVRAQGKIVAGGKLFIEEFSGVTVAMLKSKASRLKARHNIKLIVVDYLQIMEVGKINEQRERQVSWLAMSLKKLAKDLHVPVLALSQFSRASDIRQDKTPRLSDLRESGGLEHNADVVILIHNPEGGEAKLIVAKNRHGGTGRYSMAFNYGQWFEASNREVPNERYTI